MNETSFCVSLLALLQNIFAFVKNFEAFLDITKLLSKLQGSISVHQHNDEPKLENISDKELTFNTAQKMKFSIMRI